MASVKKASSWELQGYLGKGAKILKALGYDHVPEDHNPVWQALSGLAPWTYEELEPAIESGEITEEEAARMMEAGETNAELAQRLKPLIWKGKNPQKGAILHAYVVCQTANLNRLGGAVGTGALATLRQRWYASADKNAMGFKFAAQALERYLIQSADVVLVDDDRSYDRAQKQGAVRVEYKVNWSKGKEAQLESEIGDVVKSHIWPKQGWGRSYAQGHSQILADLVRSGMTYEQLWVKDASREIEKYSPLYQGFYGVLLLEKEGVFEHFQPFCRAAGIPILISMSGNNAFSSVEFVLNENFRDWDGNYKPNAENPLHIFSLTDHDYAGHVPVQDGAVAQFERYLPGAVQVHRVGVTPEIVRDLGRTILESGYIFEHDYNQAYADWAEEHGIWIGDDCYGIEIEAITPYSLYMPYLINAIVEACGGDEKLRELLAKMAQPDWYQVQRKLSQDTCELSELIGRLDALKAWAENEGWDRRSEVQRQVDPKVGQEYQSGAWRNREEVLAKAEQVVSEQSDLIDFDKYTEFVAKGGDGYSKWTPVTREAANNAVIQVFKSGWDSSGLENSDVYEEARDRAVEYYQSQGFDSEPTERDILYHMRKMVLEGEIEGEETWPFGREWELEDVAETLDASYEELVRDLQTVFQTLEDHGLEW